ncbi:D-2-hydroxyacid dehydrogenase family protein [Ramlibacter albus]|uniref:D-2-hydroxyacid dehydrogenase family protein n=1 Tax=Ramlibacter albus TaxID=2079448 RepID=A0A923S4N1_9BURK|nr:D-2-hydroxyacid dehydrogenase family protein [Ramlibacter albus]MBC5767093.1 D-2-hydroxyacid dehydrogenase family protein [Ramlibacter albus]
MPYRIAVLDDWQRNALLLADWSAVQARADVVVFHDHMQDDEAAQRLRDFDALCLMRERMAMPRALIEALPRLKLLCTTGPRHRTLDYDAAAERGIPVLAAAGTEDGNSSTIELAWGLILSLARRLPDEVQTMRSGGWQTRPGRVLRGKTIGLVGLGRQGKQMVPVAQAFGMKVLAWSTNLTPEDAAAAGAEYATKEELFSRSDVVSLHLVLSQRSRGIIGRDDLQRMKPDAVLVNTARAALVDGDALYEHLSQSRIAGVAIDVFEQEPLAADHRLRALPNVILTPHLGYATQEQLAGFYRGTVANLLAHLP